MPTISLCMIVKNEERILRRCLDSVKDLVDEIVIVDTGSTDSTKKIATEYTDKIYDFEWVDDFSKARNYSFSKCSMDYIYVADADEYLNEENRFQFKVLKENLYPEIEIVQMMYETVSHDTVLNIYREYRPKLYKRLREFTWIDPIHETVRLDPVVFNSDIVITHEPETNHSGRDFSIFEKALARDGGLSENVSHMYALELYKCGSYSDFEKALPFFESINTLDDIFIRQYSSVVIAKCLRLNRDSSFEEYVMSALKSGMRDVSELNFELGEYYLENKRYFDASKFFNAAVYDSTPVLDIHTGGDHALRRLIDACEKVITQYDDIKKSAGPDVSMEQLVEDYKEIKEKYAKDLSNWKPPVETV